MFRTVRSCEQILRKFPSSPFQSMKIRDSNSVRLMRRGAEPRNRQRRFATREFVPETLPNNEWKIGGPVLFTIGFSGLCICGAAIWEYEHFKRNGSKRTDSQPFVSQTPTLSAILNARPGNFKELWTSIGDGKKIFMGILVLNTAVYLAWKSRKLQPILNTYFCANPFSRAVCWPMVLSTFSHISIVHMAFNLYSLHSCVPVAHRMGKEQFLAFYLSAGVFSSLFSHVVNIARRLPSLGLGASGAIKGVFAFVASTYPDAKVSIAFVPAFSFSANAYIKGIVLFETLGILLGWRLIDHAAHLGGTLFGIFWYHWGQHYIWANRKVVTDAWDHINPSETVS